jgi:hypothetical protein
VLAADALAVSTAIGADRPTPLGVVAGAAGVVFVLASLLAVWDDGLVAGAVLLLIAYAVSLAGNEAAIDRKAPLVCVGLVAVVDLGSWSLELRDGAEEAPLRRLALVAALLLGAAASSTLVLAAAAAPVQAGVALWALGAAAAIGVLALIGRPAFEAS